MKQLILLLLLTAMPVMAQTTTVSGTIVDPQGNPYASGTVSAIKSVATGQNPGTPVAGTTSIVGTFSIVLPSPASYIFTVCASPTQIGPTGNPTPTQVCFSNNTPIAVSGGSQDVSSSLNAVAKVLGPNITGVSGVVSTCSANQVPFYAVNGNVVACSSVITIAGTTATVQNEVVTGTATIGTLNIGGIATVTGALAANGGATVNNGITVNGGSTLNGGGGDSGAWTHSGNHTFNGSVTSNNLNAGNVANKNFGGDHTVYVSVSGNDSSDGLSWGTAKLTVQAAINTATGSGANGGTVMLPCGSFTGPTTWYNGLSLISVCSFMVPGVAQTALTYNSTLTLANLTGVHLHNIVFDFNFTGAGLSLGNAIQGITFDGFTLKNCGNSTTDCFQGLTTTAGLGNNAVNNLFSNFYIQANITGGQFANCITLKGTTSSWTNSRFINGVCTGNVNNGLVLRANTDTDYFINYLVTNNGPTQANSGCLVINDQSPASDVDADGHMIIGMSCLGNFTNTIRAGQTTGSYITMGGLPNGIATLGGTPLYTLQNIVPGPSTATADLAIGGKLSACGATSNCTASGSLTGDVTAQRTATGGAYWMGSDGGSVIYRNINGVNISTPGSQAINFQTSGVNGATLLGINQLNTLPTVVASLPAAAANTYTTMTVSDSTAIAAEGQTCTGGGTTKALAFSNGTVWKCF